MKNIFLKYSYLLLFLFSCTKGKGAVCNDGTISNSTGCGTCSWHGGVDHYLDPNEISIEKTIVLVVLLTIAIYFYFGCKKKK